MVFWCLGLSWTRRSKCASGFTGLMNVRLAVVCVVCVLRAPKVNFFFFFLLAAFIANSRFSKIASFGDLHKMRECENEANDNI